MIRRVFLTICVLLALSSAAVAFDSGTALTVSASQETVTLRAGFSRKIDIYTMPACVEVGIDCGMPDMCGIDPCTCGSADSWGICSCNGLSNAMPDISARAKDKKIAGVSVENGTLKIRALGVGTTTVTVAAALPHYGDGSATISVTVLPFGAGLYLVCILIAAAVCAAALLAVRAVLMRRQGKAPR